MTDLICRKDLNPCKTPGMCSPHGGCQIITLECRAEVAQDTLDVIRSVLKTAEAEIEQLKAENDLLRGQAEVAQEALEVLAKDAGRYRCLLEFDGDIDFSSAESTEEIDALIDAAKSAESRP